MTGPTSARSTALEPNHARVRYAVSMRTQHDLAVWIKKETGELYGFPLGAKDAWGDPVVAGLSMEDWEFRYTIPKGVEAIGSTTVEGDRFVCTILGRKMHTAGWALRD